MELKFKPDKRIRDKFFTAKHFAHPAKMSSQLLIWIVENYTDPGDVILDPMAGSGTMMLACQMGRHCILVDLEEKFVNMMKDNWEKMQQWGALMGYEMGKCEILQGDARNLELLADVAIFSPPYVTGARGNSRSPFWERLASDPTPARFGREQHPSLGEGYSPSRNNIGNLPYGSIDCVLTSPPYSEGIGHGHAGRKADKESYPERYQMQERYAKAFQDNPANIGNLKHGDIDAIITSPPYEGQITPNGEGPGMAGNEPQRRRINCGVPTEVAASSRGQGYSSNITNIGNLKGGTYLEAMLQVYQQCHKVLKPNGLMILVTKNFIRNKQIVPLDEHTIKLCETAGFEFIDRHYRKLHAQSFWRVIAVQKCDYRSGSKDKPICKLGYTCPVDTSWQLQIALALQGVEDNVEKAIQAAERLCPYFINTVPKVEHEDVLVFEKQGVI